MTHSGREHHRAPNYPNPPCHSGEGLNPCGAPSPAIDARGGPRTWIPAFAGMTSWLVEELNSARTGMPEPPTSRPFRSSPRIHPAIGAKISPFFGGGREEVRPQTPSPSQNRQPRQKDLSPPPEPPPYWPHQSCGDGVATINSMATAGRDGDRAPPGSAGANTSVRQKTRRPEASCVSTKQSSRRKTPRGSIRQDNRIAGGASARADTDQFGE